MTTWILHKTIFCKLQKKTHLLTQNSLTQNSLLDTAKMSLERRVNWALWKRCQPAFDRDYCKWMKYVNNNADLLADLRKGYLETNEEPLEDVDLSHPLVEKWIETVATLERQKAALWDAFVDTDEVIYGVSFRGIQQELLDLADIK